MVTLLRHQEGMAPMQGRRLIKPTSRTYPSFILWTRRWGKLSQQGRSSAAMASCGFFTRRGGQADDPARFPHSLGLLLQESQEPNPRRVDLSHAGQVDVDRQDRRGLQQVVIDLGQVGEVERPFQLDDNMRSGHADPHVRVPP